jgi:hypothetical protein
MGGYQIDIVNRQFSYFYNNFLDAIERICVIGQQLPVPLPEIRAVRTRFCAKNRAIPPRPNASPRRSSNVRRALVSPVNIFSL